MGTKTGFSADLEVPKQAPWDKCPYVLPEAAGSHRTRILQKDPMAQHLLVAVRKAGPDVAAGISIHLIGNGHQNGMFRLTLRYPSRHQGGRDVVSRADAQFPTDVLVALDDRQCGVVA